MCCSLFFCFVLLSYILLLLDYINDIYEHWFRNFNFNLADFSMSNSQREHALAIERLVPELVSLRLNLCSYMNVEKFWMIYFLLLLPRLNQHDLEFLSTPKASFVSSYVISVFEPWFSRMESPIYSPHDHSNLVILHHWRISDVPGIWLICWSTHTRLEHWHWLQ